MYLTHLYLILLKNSHKYYILLLDTNVSENAPPHASCVEQTSSGSMAQQQVRNSFNNVDISCGLILFYSQKTVVGVAVFLSANKTNVYLFQQL